VLAPYVIDRMIISPKLELSLGARLDSVDFEDDATATSRDDSQLSPMGGIVWKPVPTLSVYASGGLGFAPPSIQVVGPRDPEESTQLEGGVKFAFLEGKGYASAAVYQLERENVAIPDSTGLTRQSGSQRSRGFELELSTEPKAGWSVRAHYAFNDAELTSFAEIVQTAEGFFVVDHSGNVPAFAPRHIGSLWATAPLGHGLSLAAGLRCVSDQYVSADNRNQIDTYAVADAAIFYTRNRARVGVHFRNLTSTEYATRGFGSESAIPGRPFEVLGRVELGFGSR
jgi:outer membrane receptor protein involved in Fe transport